MVNFFRKPFPGRRVDLSPSSSNGKLDPSLMQETTLSAIGLITKVNEILASLDLKDGLLAFKAINAKRKQFIQSLRPIVET